MIYLLEQYGGYEGSEVARGSASGYTLRQHSIVKGEG